MDTATILKQHYKQNIPTLQSGQVVRVSEKIVEGGRERVQVFEGLVIAVKHGRGLNGTFTVRKMALGRFGVEKVFLLHQPSIQKIEILRQEKVRRAKLYFMRDKVNKKMKKRKTKEVNSVFDLQAYTEEPVEESQEQEVEQPEQNAPEQSEQESQEQKAEEAKQDATTQNQPDDPQQELDEQKQEMEAEKQAQQEPSEAQEIEEIAEEVQEKAEKKE